MHDSLFIVLHRCRILYTNLQVLKLSYSGPSTMSKVYKMEIKAKLDCPSCPEKIMNAICSLCACEIHSKTFDKKSNKITLIGVFDPEKVAKKICEKAGKCIEVMEASEVVTQSVSTKEKVANNTQVVVVVVTPPPPPCPPPPPPPVTVLQQQIIACPPVAPVGCCHCAPPQCGCRKRTGGCCSSSQGRGSCHCVVIREEESACKTM